eukprot:scaffold322680_cov32-Tisochrysis_lutea.AAC.2
MSLHQIAGWRVPRAQARSNEEAPGTHVTACHVPRADLYDKVLLPPRLIVLKHRLAAPTSATFTAMVCASCA